MLAAFGGSAGDCRSARVWLRLLEPDRGREPACRHQPAGLPPAAARGGPRIAHRAEHRAGRHQRIPVLQLPPRRPAPTLHRAAAGPAGAHPGAEPAALADSLALLVAGWDSGHRAGSLVVANTWDVPTFRASTCYAVCSRPSDCPLRRQAAFTRLGATLGLGLLLFLPLLHRARIATARTRHRGAAHPARLDAGHLRTAACPARLRAALAVGRGLRQAGTGHTATCHRRAGSALAPIPLLVVLALAFTREGTLLLLALLAIALVPLALGLVLGPAAPAPRTRHCKFSACLARPAIAILLAVEVAFLSDAFGTRMNTVLSSTTRSGYCSPGGACFAALAAGPVTLPAPRISLAFGRLAVALGSALGIVYPLPRPIEEDGFSETPTLNGPPFWPPIAGRQRGRRLVRSLPEDRPVVVEAVGNDYSVTGASPRLGAPTVLGCIGRSSVARPIPQLEQRHADVKQIYASTDRSEVTRCSSSTASATWWWATWSARPTAKTRAISSGPGCRWCSRTPAR